MFSLPMSCTNKTLSLWPLSFLCGWNFCSQNELLRWNYGESACTCCLWYICFLCLTLAFWRSCLSDRCYAFLCCELYAIQSFLAVRSYTVWSLIHINFYNKVHFLHITHYLNAEFLIWNPMNKIEQMLMRMQTLPQHYSITWSVTGRLHNQFTLQL